MSFGFTCDGFKDDSNGTNDSNDDYSYDANGNMISDENKNISLITYNHLNLPTKITFGTTGNYISYLYTATGQKAQKIVYNGTTTSITDYMGGYQYNNSVLQFFPHTEGYVKNTVFKGNNSLEFLLKNGQIFINL